MDMPEDERRRYLEEISGGGTRGDLSEGADKYLAQSRHSQQIPADYKKKILEEEKQNQQKQRDLADAISRFAPMDDIRIMFACGAKANNVVTQGLRPLHYAAYMNFVPCAKLLLLRGCDINAMDHSGYTAVHLCAEKGFRELLELLIEHGARVNFTDMRSDYELRNKILIPDEPLSLALKRGYYPCAELLLKAGADPNAEYFFGHELNVINPLDDRGIELLLRYGARPDSRDRAGLTTLMKAARHPNGYESVKVLLAYGADPNDITDYRHGYRTVLHFSIFSGCPVLIRALLDGGARYPSLEFDKPSPLDIAMISGRSDIVRLLCEYATAGGGERSARSAGIDIVNGGASTTIGQPLHTALTQSIGSKRTIVRVLLDHGADPNSLETSKRDTGPMLADYLDSIGRPPTGSASELVSRYPSGGGAAGAHHQSIDLEIVRMLLAYGARVVLRTASAQTAPYGIARSLEKLHSDEQSFELLNLLVEAADDQIDWLIMSKIIYTFLRSANRVRSNELLDPSVSANMTPERLACELLGRERSMHAASAARLSDELLRGLANSAKGLTGVRTLKQISRTHIRRHLTDVVRLRGKQLIQGVSSLPIPSNLIKYLLYYTDLSLY